MKRHFKTFVVAAAAIAATTLQTIPAQACGPRGGGGRGGFSVGYGRVGISVSHAPVYRSVPQRVYAQPQYVQPQPVYSQPIQPQPVFASQPAPVFSQQPMIQPSPVVTSPVVTSPVVTSPVVTSPRPAVAPVNVAPAVQRPVASNNTLPANVANTNEASALQMLASLSGNEASAPDSTAQIPEFTSASSAATNPHTGTWKVNLPGNQSVELLLNDDSSFSWTATKDGKSSSFQGQFRLESDRLTLVRSSDLQQMTGTWSGQGTNFTFKLDGATTSGLAFVRS